MAINGVTSTLPDPRWVKAVEDEMADLRRQIGLNTQQVQTVSKR